HEEHGATRAVRRTTEKQESTVGVDRDHVEVEGGDLLATHTTGHLHALEHPSRSSTGTDRTGSTMLLVVAMGGLLTGEIVTFHHSGKALALGDTGDVGLNADLEEFGDIDLLTEGVDTRIVDLDLDQRPSGIDTGLGVVPCGRLVDTPGLAICDLDGVVA